MTLRSLATIVVAGLLSLSPSTVAGEQACQVLDREGNDITDVVVTQDPDDVSLSVVQCNDDMKCAYGNITNCNKVRCTGKHVCVSTVIENFTHQVECVGSSACAKSHMTAVPTPPADGYPQNVVCEGLDVCDVAVIQFSEDSGDEDVLNAASMDVMCSGAQSCRKAKLHVGLEGTVTCRDGGNRYEACLASTQVTGGCLRCEGNRACRPFINECSYKLTEDEKHQICNEGENGNCGFEETTTVEIETVEAENVEEEIAEEDALEEEIAEEDAFDEEIAEGNEP